MTGTLRWFKSSYSSDSGGECLEVAYAWRKSSYSSASGGECLEAAHDRTLGAIHIRDTKKPDGPAVTITAATWSAFLTAAPHTPSQKM